MTAETLKAKRLSLGLSQGQLATALGLDRMSISRWERGVHKVPKFALMAIDAIK